MKTKNKNNIKETIKNKMNLIAELNEENEGIKKESSSFKVVMKNSERISELVKEVDRLMESVDDYEPISSDDGTFTAYRMRVAKNGVNMQQILSTGLFAWFVQYHPECLELNLKKAEEVTGLDLSAYAKRDGYNKYTVSTNEDYRYIMDLISDYHDQGTDRRDTLES